MPRGSSAHDGSSGRADAAATWMDGELLAALECGSASDADGRTTTAGLPRIGSTGRTPHRQVGRSRRIRTRGDRGFRRGNVSGPELPDALKLSAWDRPTESHASELAAGLREMTTRGVAGNIAARYLARVAPLVTLCRREITANVRAAPRVGRSAPPKHTEGKGVRRSPVR